MLLLYRNRGQLSVLWHEPGQLFSVQGMSSRASPFLTFKNMAYALSLLSNVDGHSIHSFHSKEADESDESVEVVEALDLGTVDGTGTDTGTGGGASSEIVTAVVGQARESLSDRLNSVARLIKGLIGVMSDTTLPVRES